MEAVAVDAWAIAGFVFGQPFAERVERWLAKARRGEVVLAMTTVNWGEVVYNVAQRAPLAVEAVIADIDRIPVELMPVDRRLATLAARLKAERRLDYADSFAAALAIALDAPLLTGDPHFRELLPELRLEWVGE